MLLIHTIIKLMNNVDPFKVIVLFVLILEDVLINLKLVKIIKKKNPVSKLQYQLTSIVCGKIMNAEVLNYVKISTFFHHIQLHHANRFHLNVKSILQMMDALIKYVLIMLTRLLMIVNLLIIVQLIKVKINVFL